MTADMLCIGDRLWIYGCKRRDDNLPFTPFQGYGTLNVVLRRGGLIGKSHKPVNGVC